MPKTLLLIDSHALIHRAFHALPPLSTPEGEPIGAIYGLTSILLKTLKDIKPDFVAAAFDRPEPTFRKEMYEEYKAHRPKIADELVSQLIKAREVFGAFGIKIFEMAGFEADDIIGTFVHKTEKEKDLRAVILTGDLDTLQLVSGNRVVVQTPKKGLSDKMIYDDAAVKERFGLAPSQMTDYKGLVGDPSDNIPGVRGVGPKTAEKLLQEFGTLENMFKKAKSDHPMAKKVIPFEKDALFSKKLSVIETGVPIDVRLDDLAWDKIDEGALIPYLTKLGFQSLIDRMLKEIPKSTAKEKPLTLNFENVVKRSDVLFFEHGFDLNLRQIDLQKNILKVGWDFKGLYKKCADQGILIHQPIFDLQIVGWLLDPDRRDLEFEDLARRFLRKSARATEIADVEELFGFFEAKIKEYGLEKVVREIDMPLIEILAAMEGWGIKIDPKKLLGLKKEIEDSLGDISKKIFEISGGPFNIKSPKQVAEILFTKLNIAFGKKTKKTSSGQQSTAEDALKKIKSAHPIIPLILQYREHAKILGTYVEPLLILSKISRIHSNFIQTGTGTGRISSEKPNLQNVPQESIWAPKLRQAFEAERGFSFVSFDYSQLELRLLAHLSGDKKLVEAFHKGEDIHTLTASQIFGVSKEKVDTRMRRIGKTLNFGVVYGMGSRAFAEMSGLTFEEADSFIREYDKRFPAIKTWQEKIKAEARTLGFVANENGRRRWFFSINSPNPRIRSEAERAAINMPTQGLGADILKLGMIKSKEVLVGLGFWNNKARLILSIHDELLFEVSDDILKKTASTLKKMLEVVYSLGVPLEVGVKTGKTWGSAEIYSP